MNGKRQTTSHEGFGITINNMVTKALWLESTTLNIEQIHIRKDHNLDTCNCFKFLTRGSIKLKMKGKLVH